MSRAEIERAYDDVIRADIALNHELNRRDEFFRKLAETNKLVSAAQEAVLKARDARRKLTGRW